MERTGKRMSEVGGQLTRSVSLPLAAIGGLSVKAFADFDAAMNQSIAIMGDVSDSLKNEMAGAAREMAKETVFSAKQAAESYFFLASAGLDAESSIAALPTVAKFAQAGMFDMALATDLLTDAQSALGLTIRDDAVANMENMVRVSDVLVRANTLANATVEQFSTSLTREAGAALKSMNKDVEEGVALLAAFADQGVKGEVAGTGLSRIIRLMSKAALDNAEAYDRLNVSVFDSQGNMRNFADIIGDLENAFADLSPKQRAAELANLGFQARVQGVILPLIGTSEAIRNYEKELRSAASFTDKVSDNQLKSFTNQMKLVRDQLIDAGITLGSSLAPIIQDFSKNTLVPWIKRIAAAAEAFARLPPAMRTSIVAVGAFAAAAGPALFVTGQLITAWGTLASSAPRVAAAIASLINPVNLLAAAFAGLLLVINNTITKWREAMQLEIETMVSQAQRVGGAIKTLRSALREGEVGSADLERARDVSAGLAEEISRVTREITKAEMKLGSLTADQWLVQKEKVQELEKELSRLGADKANLDKFLQLAAGLPIVLEESGSAAEEAAGPPGGITQMSDALKDALGAMSDAVNENQALLDALLESQEAYDTLNVLLEAGVPLNEALSGAYDKQAQKLLKLQKLLDALIAKREKASDLAAKAIRLEEELNSAIQKTIDTSASGEIRTEMPLFDPRSLEAITKGAEAVGAAVRAIRQEELRRVEALAEINRLLEAGLITQEEAQAVAEKMNLETNAMAEALETMMKRAWENVQDIASDAIAEIIKTGKVDFENLFDSILDVVAQMLAKMLVMWLANLAKRVAAEQAAAATSAATWAAVGSASGGAGFTGGGGTGMLANFGATAISKGVFGGTGTGWASTLAAAAPLLLVAGLALWGFAKAASTQSKHTGGQVQFGFPTQMGVAFNDSMKMARQMQQALEVLQDTFSEIERVTGTSINILEQAVINVKNNGKIFVNIGEEFSVQVADMAEALDLVVTHLLRSAEISGGSAAVRAALENSVATSIDELQAEVAAALRSEELFLGMEGRTAIREKTNEFFELLNKEIELGIIQAQGGSGALVGLVSFYQQSFDQLMGIQRDAAEQARMNARAHNAALKMDVARLMALRAEILATGASAAATAANAKVNAGSARVMVQMAEVTAGATEVQAGYAEVMAGGAKVTHGMTEVMAVAAQTAGANAEAQGALAQTQAAGATVAMTAAQANAAALAAIDEALAALEGLEVDLDAAAAAARRAGQGGGPGAEMQQLRDLLDQMRFDRLLLGMTELEAGLARLDRQYQKQLKMAHGNAELVAALTEEYRLQEEQLRRNIQLSAVDTFQEFMGIGQDPFAQLGKGFEGAVSAIEDAGFGAQRTRLMVARLTDEYERQLDVLSRQEFVAIGDSLMGIVDRYFSGVEGFEEFRMRLEQTRFQLELANLRARFEILKAEGTLAQAVLNQIQGVFDFIDENPIDWSAFVAPAAPRVQRAAREVNNAFEEMARRLNSAKESIRDFLASLQTGAFGGRSNKQMFEAAQDQFQKIRQGVQAGNIQAIEQFPEVARRFLEIARERFASGEEFQKILALVEATGIDILGVDRVTQDNVVFDQRFFQGQQSQAKEIRSVAEISDRGFAAVSQDLGRLVAENKMLRERVEGIEDELRLRRQAEERKSA